MEYFAISASRDGFRRAGRAWGRQAKVVAAGDLTDAQLQMLRADPNITVTPCAPEGDPEAAAGGAPAAAPSAEQIQEALRGMNVAMLRGWLIRAAMGELEPGNEDHFTRAGAPEIAALRELAGLSSISAAERDELWRLHRDGAESAPAKGLPS